MCLKMRLYPNVDGGNTFSKSMLLIIYCHSLAIGTLGFCLFEEKSQNNLSVTVSADANHLNLHSLWVYPHLKFALEIFAPLLPFSKETIVSY